MGCSALMGSEITARVLRGYLKCFLLNKNTLNHPSLISKIFIFAIFKMIMVFCNCIVPFFTLFPRLELPAFMS